MPQLYIAWCGVTMAQQDNTARTANFFDLCTLATLSKALPELESITPSVIKT
jgi:hypothetical protein